MKLFNTVYGSSTNFATEFLIDDLKVLIPFHKWDKIDRKNKLSKLKTNKS